MYQCIKVSKYSTDNKVFWLSKFLDTERAEVFTVYTRKEPVYEIDVSYDLILAPNFKGFNFLQNE